MRRHTKTKRTCLQWVAWKARSLRGSFRAVARRHGRDVAEVPSVAELEMWLQGAITLGCYYCMVALTPKNFSVDHKRPVSRGGSNTIENFAQTCLGCNLAKGSMTEHEFQCLRRLLATWDDYGKAVLARLKRGHFGRR